MKKKELNLCLFIIIPGILFFGACMSNSGSFDSSPGGGRKNNEPLPAMSHITYYFDKSLLHSGPVDLGSWLVYSVAIAEDMETFYKEYTPVYEYIPSYETELEARRKMIQTYFKLKAQGMVSGDKYLVELSRIYESGYLKEYVYEYYKQATWEMPGELKPDEFRLWIKETFPGHMAQTKANAVYDPEGSGKTIFVDSSSTGLRPVRMP